MKKHWIIILVVVVVVVAAILLFSKKAKAAPAQPSDAQIKANLQSLTDYFSNTPYQSSATDSAASAMNSNNGSSLTDSYLVSMWKSWGNIFNTSKPITAN